MKQSNKENSLFIVLAAIIVLTIVLVISTSLIQQKNNQNTPLATSDNEKEPSQQVDEKKEPSPIVRFEAEEGAFNGTIISTSGKEYSGDGFVTDFTDEKDDVTITVIAEKEQLYQLYVGYYASGYKEAFLYVNDDPFGKVIFKQNSSFESVKAARIMLEEGENTIKIERGWGYYDIDYVEIQALDISDYQVAPITEKLSNPNATPEAVELMNYLNEQAGKYVISGQQSLKHTIDVENMTGKRPAIVAFDFIEYSPTRAKYGSKSFELESAVTWHKMGGIVSFLWHWNAPTGIIDEPGKEWWKGFYTDSVDFNLADALADKSSPEYELLLSDMDVIAQKIKVLKINEIPVLFRPLHEAEGGWFWWGASGPEAAKELYRIMYDRFVNVHELNNLIWVWNSVDPEWYPGDDVVDIVSYDSYPIAGDHSPVTSYYDRLFELTGGTKYIAMMENGSIPDPDAMEQYGANWGLFITWNDEFLKDGKHNSKEFLNKLYNNPRVITLEDLPAYKAKQQQ